MNEYGYLIKTKAALESVIFGVIFCFIIQFLDELMNKNMGFTWTSMWCFNRSI
jgi:hypothetical protein